MKRLCFVSIFGLFLVLYGCSGLGKDDSTGSLQSFLLSYTPYYMDVSPKRGVVGREGGEVVIRVCMSDTLRNGDHVPFTLKGELFFDGIDGSGDDYLEPFALGIPFVYLKERKQINDYEVSYTFVFDANDTQSDRVFAWSILAWDRDRYTSCWNDANLFIGLFSITQSGL